MVRDSNPSLASHYRNCYRNRIRICDENDEAHTKPLITSRDHAGHYKSPLPRSFLSFPQKTPRRLPEEDLMRQLKVAQHLSRVFSCPISSLFSSR